MKRLFLAFLVLMSFLAIVMLNNPSFAQIDPNEAILQGLKNGGSNKFFNVIKVTKDDKQQKKAEEAKAARQAKRQAAREARIKSQKEAAEKARIADLQAEKEKQQQTATKTTRQITKITRGSYKKDPNEAVIRKFGIEDAAAERELNKLSTAAGPRRASTWFSTTDQGQRMTISFSDKPSYQELKEKGRVRLKFTSPVIYAAPKIPSKFSKTFISLKETSEKNSNLALEIVTGSEYEIKISSYKDKLYIDAIDIAKITAAAEQEKIIAQALKQQEKDRQDAKRLAEEQRLAEIKAAEEKAAAEKLAAEEAKKAEEQAKLDANGIPQIDIEKLLNVTENRNKVETKALGEKEVPIESGVKFFVENEIERLVIDFEKPVPAAVVERFGYYWLVFDTEESYEMPKELEKSTIFGDAKKVDSSSLVYKLALTKNAYAVVERTGSRWVIEFDPQLEYELDKPLQVFENNEYLSIKTSNAGKIVTINDGLYNEELNIVPLAEAGQGISRRVNRNDVIFDPTVQGILFREVREIAGVEINNNGLKISKVESASEKGEKDMKHAVYDFRKWPQLSAEALTAVRRNLLGKNRFDYGALFFSQKMYGEAAINLQGLKGYKADFLYAASEFMDSRYDKSLAGFNGVNLPSDVDGDELLMWQIAANYMLSKTRAEKAQEVEFTENFQLPENIRNYPDIISAKVLLALIEKKIDKDDLESAQHYINAMPKRAHVEQYNYKNYLQARIYDQQGKESRAREIWEALSGKLEDRYVRSRATANVILQDYENEKISQEEMVAELDKARVIWRGDEFEYNLLLKIAGINSELNRGRNALRSYKEAITHFPDHPNNEKVLSEMQKIYRNTILSNFQDESKAFEVVATYYEFEELKPGGDDGDQITLELAEKLVDFDLLAEAIDVLGKYSRKIRDKEERALVMTRLSILQYMNHQPEAALETLAKSEIKPMPAYLKNERDLLLAESLILAGKDDLAITALSYLPPHKANKLKAQVYWKNKEWKEMIAVYDEVAQKSDVDILKLAVANTILGDKVRLKELKETYAKQMQNSPLESNFAFVTNTQSVDYKNLTGTLKIELLKDVVGAYRSRLKLGDYAAAGIGK